MRFEYVVVGGGTAGCVVASRLAEAGRDVCLIEAGPSDRDDPGILELRNHPSLVGTALDYDYAIVPQERSRDFRAARARMLGGCSSHNGCIAIRPADVEFRNWERLGARGWGPDALDPCFERVIERVNFETDPPDNPCVAAFLAAGRQLGFPEITFDVRARAVGDGVGWLQLNARGPRRESSSQAYLRRTEPLPNLTVMTDTVAHRIRFDGDRATGVETAAGCVQADREVVLGAGAFDTPKLLLLSGVGPRDHLREVGIAVRVDAAGVGEHLLDHPEGVITWEATRPVPQETRQYCEAVLLARSDAAAEHPELMCWFLTRPFDKTTMRAPGSPHGHVFSLACDVARSRSTGTVRLRSADPADPPVIDPRYLTDPDGYDERMLLEGIRLARRLAERSPLQEWIAREVAPGPELRGDAELRAYLRSTTSTAYHPAGTCRIGDADDPLAVVAPDLRVHGVDGLRVADASIFPAMMTAGPNVSCMMIGERCAELVLAGEPEAAAVGRSRVGGPATS